MKPVGPIAQDAIRAAHSRIAGTAIRSPLLPLDVPGAPTEVWVKLECLQPIGSFKVRGATNALALADPAVIARGVYTGSAGNMAQGLALAARRLGVPCRVVVPETAPRNKLDAIARLGATAVPLPFDEWWSVLRDHGHPDEDGHFVHPVSDSAVIAGNGTVGMEIVEELPGVRAIVVPYGGGGLSCGIAASVAAARPGVPVFASEIETAAPFAAALGAGRPVGSAHALVRRCIGSTRVLDELAVARAAGRVAGGLGRGDVCGDQSAVRTRARGGGGGGGDIGRGCVERAARDRARPCRGRRLRRQHRRGCAADNPGGTDALTGARVPTLAPGRPAP